MTTAKLEKGKLNPDLVEAAFREEWPEVAERMDAKARGASPTVAKAPSAKPASAPPAPAPSASTPAFDRVENREVRFGCAVDDRAAARVAGKKPETKPDLAMGNLSPGVRALAAQIAASTAGGMKPALPSATPPGNAQAGGLVTGREFAARLKMTINDFYALVNSKSQSIIPRPAAYRDGGQTALFTRDDVEATVAKMAR